MSRTRSRLEWAVLALNTAGFLGYLLWLVFKGHRIFYAQDGVLYLLPCLPFFFVYLYLLRRREPPPDTSGD
jgi:hypothetical protein